MRALTAVTLIPALLAGTLLGCGGGDGEQVLLQSQKRPIDKAREAERLLQERAQADRERLDQL